MYKKTNVLLDVIYKGVIQINIKPYYPILEAEIAKSGIKKKEIADKIGLMPKTLSNKLVGKTEFTLSEALRINKFFPALTVNQLFSREK